MKLPEAAVRRPVLTSMVFTGLLILGAVSFTRLQVDLLPEIDFPSISIVTVYDGAGPEEIETLITRPLEQALATVEGIDRIESYSAEGRSRIALRFAWGTSLDAALNDVRAVVERRKDDLPEDAESPVIYKFNLSAFPVLSAGLSGALDEPTLRQLAERQLSPRLERVEGVAAANIRGGLKREIHILLQTDRLRSLTVSPAQVVDAIRQGNRNVPAGLVEQFDDNVLLRAVGESLEVADFADIVVANRRERDGLEHAILLRDIAEIIDTFEDPTNVVYINGQPGIRITVNKQSGANTVEVSDRVQREIEAINRDYLGRARLDVITDTADYIEASITNVQSSVLAGALLAVLVLLFALRNLRSTFIIATGIPISVIGIFTLMYAFDITLNLVSFGGVALGIGMLVDNAIVILENVFRKLEEGESPRRAAINGANEVSSAIIASTTTTIVVFAPVIFLSGFAAIFFGQMAFVVTFALVASLAVALTLIPVLASKLLRVGATEHAHQGRIGRFLEAGETRYAALLDEALAHRKVTILIAACALVGSLALVPLVGSELMPEGDQSEVAIGLEMPVGTRIEVTDAAARKLEAIVARELPHVRNIQTVVGTPGFWSTAGEESASIVATLVPPTERPESSEQLAAELRPDLEHVIAGADLRVQAGGGLWILRMLRGGGERLEVQVRGYELDVAERLSDEVRRIMLATGGISGVRVSRKPGGREIRIVPDRKKIAGLGLRYADVARQLQTYVQGTRASVLRAGGDEFDVIVRLSRSEVGDIDAALDVPVVIPGVGTTPLRNLVRTEQTEGPLVIERLNQGRVVTISAVLTGDVDLGSIGDTLRARFAELDYPDTFSVLVAGETEEQAKTFESLFIGVLLAVALVFMVMASQFESYVQPLMIMFSIPFAIVGVLLSLALTGTTFNLQSFMGVIVLVGVVVNNAIVLIDYINIQRREHGMGVRAAVTYSARRRLRPIMMTTATTVLALLPLAIGFAEGGETQAPLARVVIGGLISATGISLILIPVIYDLVESRREARSRPVARGS